MNYRFIVQRFWLAAWLGIGGGFTAAFSAPFEKEPPEFQCVDLTLRPGLCSVERLLLLPDGLYGVTLGEGSEIGYFNLEAGGEKAVKVEALPPDVIEPCEIVDRDSCFTWAPDARTAYSLSPEGKLLKHTGRGAQRKTEELGQVSGTRPFEGKPRVAVEGYQRSRTMFFDAHAALYTAGKEGFLFRYSPGATGPVEKLTAQLPAVRGREPWASLDAAVLGPDGLVYGGTFDGYLFSLDLKTMTVVNLGKPLRQSRIPGLVFRDGKLYGIGGEEDALPRTFMYDPATRGFTLGGPIMPPAPGSGSNIIDGFSTPALAVDPQGRIYFGSTGRLGRLYRWNPKP